MANPTTERTAHTTRRMMSTVHMSVSVLAARISRCPLTRSTSSAVRDLRDAGAGQLRRLVPKCSEIRGTVEARGW